MRLWLPRRPVIALATVVLLSAALFAQPAKSVSDRDPSVLARLTDDARVGLDVPGLSAAIASGESIVWAEGFGSADLEQNVAVRPETVFRIASISKPITATAVMQLVERGLVSIEDPIQRYVPGFPRKPQGEIRLRHLLSHTSGIRHYRGDEFGLNDYYPTVDRALAVFQNDPLEFAPGERYSYSTYGYNLLAGVVEAASGRTFDDYLRANIFEPAGMTSTFLERPQEIVQYRARQYVRGSSPMIWLNAPYVDLSVKWAGGGMISTASDLLRFDLALNAGRLLRHDTQDRMYTPTRLNSGATTAYGLGWMVSQDGGRIKVAHSGGAMGGTTYLLRDPKARVASVVLANLDNVPRLRDLADQLMTLAPRTPASSTR
ncbi:MAG TPA: serine hydrolase domain-containing protein [Vicinamibacterales bacterium]|nr:serine hydrolase domain-containing protein [Vicinamibacterales bacterium]